MQNNSVENSLIYPKNKSASHCPTELFPIYPNNHWTIRWRDDHIIVPSSSRIKLKNDWFVVLNLSMLCLVTINLWFCRCKTYNKVFLLENIAKSKRFLFRFRAYGLFCWIYGCRWFVCGTWVCIWIRRFHVSVSSNLFALLDKKYCIEYSQELKSTTNCIDDFITKMWSYFTRDTWSKALKIIF